MIRHLLALGAFAILPVAAMGNSTSSDNGDMRTLSVQAGQGGQYWITIPDHPNVQESAQAPYGLTGQSAAETTHHYRLMNVGQGGMVLVPMD